MEIETAYRQSALAEAPDGLKAERVLIQMREELYR
jgi:hypothetical protein